MRGAEEAVRPTAHEHLAVALLLPDKVGDAEHLSQAVHGQVTAGQAVEERGLGLGIGPFRHPEAQPGLAADRRQDAPQIEVAQVQRQRVGQDRRQFAADQDLLHADVVGMLQLAMKL